MSLIKKIDSKGVGFKKYIFLGIFILLILGILEIWANNTMVNYGEKLVQINRLQENLKLENGILENELAKLASLDSIATQASQLGFSKSKAVQYLH